MAKILGFKKPRASRQQSNVLAQQRAANRQRELALDNKEAAENEKRAKKEESRKEVKNRAKGVGSLVNSFLGVETKDDEGIVKKRKKLG